LCFICVVCNISTSSNGGVLYLKSAGLINVINSSFSKVEAKSGGAVYVVMDTLVVVSGCIFSEVRALEGGGGAIYFGENTGFIIESL
jgi:hypothetical protein